MTILLSHHAHTRAAQRNLSQGDIDYILQHGRRHHAADAIFYFLRRRDIPDKDRRRMARLACTAIITNRERTAVITLWRNRLHGARNIRRKQARTR